MGYASAAQRKAVWASKNEKKQLERQKEKLEKLEEKRNNGI